MIPVSRHEIATGPAETYFTLQLQWEIKFLAGKTGQCSTCKHGSLPKPIRHLLTFFSQIDIM